MDSSASGVQFDPETRRAITETRDFDFAAGLNPLSQKKRDQILGFYEERLPPDVANKRPKALAQLGNLLSSDGQQDLAITVYEESLQRDPRDPFTQYALGHTLLQSGRLHDATKALDAAIALRPDMIEAHEDLALTYARQGASDSARAELVRVIQMNPTRASAHFELGVLLSHDPTNRAAAMEELEEGLRLQPSNVHGRQALEELTRMQETLRLAKQIAATRVTAQPNDAFAYFSLGVSMLRLGNCNDALGALQKAISLQPSLGEAHANLAIAQYCLGQYADAHKQVDLSRQFGVNPAPEFVAALESKIRQ
jgi:tetratricopeptide (TPR) repeat protein